MRRVASWVLLVGLLLNGALVAGTVIYAQQSPITDVLAFVSWRDGHADIYLRDLSTPHLLPFANGVGETTGVPRWSADGGGIAFETAIDARNLIGVLQYPHYKIPRLIDVNSGRIFDPVWSPDGTFIAYVAVVEIFIEEADSGFVSSMQRDIYRMDADGDNITELTRHPADDTTPVWSPDGTRIAFESRRNGNMDIYTINADGSNLQNLTGTSTSETSPVWSSDGSRIAFQGSRDGFAIDVYAMDAEGSNVDNLTNHPTANISPVWSPDGTQIAFVSRRDGDLEIYVMDRDGSNPRNLSSHPSPDLSPVWSPDGTRIAFVSRRDGNEEIYLVEVASGLLHRLTDHPAPDLLPAWRPEP